MARKAFILERGLLNIKRLQSLEKGLQPDERDLVAKMRVFARFQSQQEHERLLSNTIAERRLRQRIQQLRHYRLLGANTLAEAEEFEHRRKSQAQGQPPSKSAKSDAAGPSPTQHSAAKVLMRPNQHLPVNPSLLPGGEMLTQRRGLFPSRRALCLWLHE